MPRQVKNTTPIPKRSRGAGERTDPLLELENERAGTLGYIRELEDSARSIREKGFTAQSFESISSVGARLEEMFRHREDLEEENLFPKLRKSDPESVRGFSQDHRAARALFGNLMATVRDIEGGRIHGSSVGDLLRTILELVTLLRRHIIHEGDVLAPFVRQKTRGEPPGYHGN